jgi:hypothetical protein
MNSLINTILANYVPVIVALGLVIGIFAIAIAGVIRNSGSHEDVARSNYIVKTVLVGFSMLFISGVFVFAFHNFYISHYYVDVEQSVTQRLPNASDINNTDLLATQLNDVQTSIQDPRCILLVVDTIDCVRKTINDVIGVIIGKTVRGLGDAVGKVADNIGFNFFFNVPADVFDMSANVSATQLERAVNFDNLIKVSEVIGLAFVYLLIVTHYFKSIIFSLDNDYSSDFVGDIGKMLLGFTSVFLAKFAAEAIIKTAAAFAGFLWNGPLAAGLTIALKAIITDGLWNSFGGFTIALVGLAIFVLIYIILFGFILFKNAKRYFILLVMILLAPIFTPMLFFDMTKTMGLIFWNKFLTTSFSLIFDLLILLLVFVFLNSGGFSLGNLILLLIGMAVVADSNNLIQQISLASEVSGFRSVVRSGLKSGANHVINLRRVFSSNSNN